MNSAVFCIVCSFANPFCRIRNEECIQVGLSEFSMRLFDMVQACLCVVVCDCAFVVFMLLCVALIVMSALGSIDYELCVFGNSCLKCTC